MNLTSLRCLVCCLLLSTVMAAETLDEQRIAADAARLIAIPDRGMGSTGAKEAAQFIADELQAVGLKPYLVRTTVAVAADAGSTLVVAGATITLTPHRPPRG